MDSDKLTFHRLIRLLWRVTERPLRLRTPLLFLTMLLAAALEMASLAGIQVYLSFLLNGQLTAGNPMTAVLGGLELRQQTVLLSLGLVLILLIKLLISLLAAWILARTASGYQISLSTRLFKAYVLAPYTWFLSRNTSELQRNLLHDVNQVSNSIVVPVLQLALNSVVSLGLLTFVLVTLSPAIFVAVGAIASVLIFVSLLAQRVLIMAGKQSRLASGDALKAAYEGMNTLTESRVMVRWDAFVAQFRRAVGRLGWASRRRIFLMQSVPIILETAIITAFVAIVTGLVFSSDDVASAFATSAVLAVAIFRLRQIMNKIVTSINRIGSASASLPPMVADIQALEPLSGGVPRRVPAPKNGFSILRFCDAKFAYENQHRPAIDGITTEIHRGEHVVVMGATGAGKSTFLHLLLGLIEVTNGSVEIDGRAMSEALSDWCAQIGYVPQQVFLVDDTIAANVAFGVPESQRDPTRIRQALELAHLWDFVAGLPAGIDTPVGEDGSVLSGGQRQRIGIARALFRGPTVMILDEATSALDRDTQSRVMQSLSALPQNPTIISVTHHIESLEYADRIVLLDGGRIAADGPVEEVRRQNAFQRITRTSGPVVLAKE